MDSYLCASHGVDLASLLDAKDAGKQEEQSWCTLTLLYQPTALTVCLVLCQLLPAASPSSPSSSSTRLILSQT